jgi:isoleucyl-tRNA synthetase
LILAKNLVGKQFGKGFYESKDLTDFENFKKEIRIHTKYLLKRSGFSWNQIEQLMPLVLHQNAENAFRVISGDFVTIEDGTGIVHTSPTFGADDAKVAKEAVPEIPPMLVLDAYGTSC